MKIQSISNIITNSSSEVFVRYDSDSVNTFKEKIRKLINMFDKNIDIDECFEIIPLFDDEEEAISCWQDDNETEDMPSKEQIYEYVMNNTSEAFRCGERLWPMVDELEIRAKKPEYVELAEILTYLTKPFDSEELGC